MKRDGIVLRNETLKAGENIQGPSKQLSPFTNEEFYSPLVWNVSR